RPSGIPALMGDGRTPRLDLAREKNTAPGKKGPLDDEVAKWTHGPHPPESRSQRSEGRPLPRRCASSRAGRRRMSTGESRAAFRSHRRRVHRVDTADGPFITEVAMSVQTVAGKFMELCQQGKHFEVMRTLYGPEMVSVEGDGKETVGKEAVIR